MNGDPAAGVKTKRKAELVKEDNGSKRKVRVKKIRTEPQSTSGDKACDTKRSRKFPTEASVKTEPQIDTDPQIVKLKTEIPMISTEINSPYRRITRSCAKQMKLKHTTLLNENVQVKNERLRTSGSKPKPDEKPKQKSSSMTAKETKVRVKKTENKLVNRKKKASLAVHLEQENLKQAVTGAKIEKTTEGQTKQKSRRLQPKSSTQIKALEGDKCKDGSKMKKFVGAHLSISGGLEKVIHGARDIGAKAVGLFLKSQRTWKSKALEEKAVEKFKKACEEHKFPTQMILPHGSYLLNCGSPKDEILTKSRENLIDDLHRCDRLGIQLFNFHPGSTCGEISVDECISKIAESINIAHSKTKHVTVVIENMSCQGHTIGGKFEELRDIISAVKDKDRIGVCLDTCHAFAAGFDLRTKAGYEQMMTDFENIIGLQYLKAMHLNDSKGNVGCHLDRHENIGKGKIGLNGFRHIMHDERLDNIPMLLETPPTLDDSEEIKLLYSL